MGGGRSLAHRGLHPDQAGQSRRGKGAEGHGGTCCRCTRAAEEFSGLVSEVHGPETANSSHGPCPPSGMAVHPSSARLSDELLCTICTCVTLLNFQRALRLGALSIRAGQQSEPPLSDLTPNSSRAVYPRPLGDNQRVPCGGKAKGR